MATGDDTGPSTPDADDAGQPEDAGQREVGGHREVDGAREAATAPEGIRRSLARGGRPRVGRRFDAVMRTARASRPAPAPERQWVAGQVPPPPPDPPRRWAATDAPGEPAGAPAPPGEPGEGGTVAGVPDPAAAEPTVTATGEGILRPDEVAALRAAAAGPARRRRVLGMPWPPPLASMLAVTVVALLAFGLGAVVGGRSAPLAGGTPGTQAADARAGLADRGPTDSVPVAARTTVPAGRAPAACLDTARFGDETISLLTANIRDRRLDDALLRYAAASRACRQAAGSP
jgi:hypothetical protein